ncbi:sigma-70 family RNA polymerase sigma factor [Kordiimonas aquimaris]|uniref:sigma-70 family RNA polymerase sigma factor n=1 Tax=Kordiimonas aquimaris TaxID=707591 RepID=UPI0021D2E12A|nr:sigma-70 family RNA polymerase sigma factor [Kordiimonas aquimaris]
MAQTQTQTSPETEGGIADEALVVRVQSGDRQAFSILVTRHALRFRSIANRVLGDVTQSEEVVQDAFVKLWVKADAYDAGRAKFTTWFHRVVVNRALDVKRQKKPVSLPEGYEAADTRPQADRTVEQSEHMARLAAAMENLSDRQKTALTLSYLDGYSNNDAADIMALNVKAFESLLVRARAKMRDMLKAEKDNLLSVFG